MAAQPETTASHRGAQHGPAVWRAADVLADRSWEVTLTDAHRSAIVGATRAAIAAGLSIAALDRDLFPLPSMTAEIASSMKCSTRPERSSPSSI